MRFATSRTVGAALLALGSLSGLPQTAVTAHPGGLAADGCHTDRKTGERHCHRASSQSAQPRAEQATRSSSGAIYFPNCTAARNAGRAPIRRGQPGYGPHLDRDNDGIACE